MKIVRTTILPFKGFTAINLLGLLFVHPGVYLSEELMNHERIHSAQQREMLFVFFYIAYLLDNQRNLNYLESRPMYAWRRYMKRRPNSYQRKKR